jgi:hypothetical protein
MKEVPTQNPEPGFYYHFKHDETKGVTDHAYEVFGPSWHTETGEWSVMYRPLYDLIIDDVLITICNRPLAMFLEETKDKSGTSIPRFAKITNGRTIQALRKVRSHLYPSL